MADSIIGQNRSCGLDPQQVLALVRPWSHVKFKHLTLHLQRGDACSPPVCPNTAPPPLRQVLYTLDVSQYAIGAGEGENFYHCINKALQTREPLLMRQLAGQVAACKLMCLTSMDS
jgi:hypothetical protein